jgi:CheY-like chemotaxis protein
MSVSHSSSQDELPEAWLDQVKQALEHLYDFPYLQNHPLATREPLPMESRRETASQRLRRELMEAIATLNPGPGVPFRAPHARLYNLLHLHYVEGFTIQEAAHELGVSLRQAYRDLRRGEEGVATALWAARAARQAPSPRARDLSSVQEEIARLEAHPRPTDLGALLLRAQKAVGALASRHGVRFINALPTEPALFTTDPVIAQQILVSTLSHAIQHARPGDLTLTLQMQGEQAAIQLTYPSEPGTPPEPADRTTAQLMERLGWQMRRSLDPQGICTITIQLTAPGPTVLVIDDNEGLVELFERYLTGHACRVIAASSGRQGLQLAQTLTPSAIVLDVMMPEMDGWEVLQTLRTRPQTMATPVIVCSVFNDPELAYSLGASLFLPKPVRRDDVLAALRQLNVV